MFDLLQLRSGQVRSGGVLTHLHIFEPASHADNFLVLQTGLDKVQYGIMRKIGKYVYDLLGCLTSSPVCTEHILWQCNLCSLLIIDES